MEEKDKEDDRREARIISGIGKEMEARALSFQTVTPQGVRDAIREIVSPIRAEIHALLASRLPTELAPPPAAITYALS